MTFVPGVGLSNPDPLSGPAEVEVIAQLDGDVTLTPEPATLSLLGLGLAGLVAKVARRKNR
jgi:hypothetical protein